MATDFEIWTFKDSPKYCRAPIYIGGDQQVHIMQPFDSKKQEAGPEPHDIDEWFKLLKTHGQVVLSFEALDHFIETLQEFRKARLEAKKK